ncbi:hypothetical protein ACGFKZ_29530 [Micromonospora tulbaghiae]|uniref:hypothetical protein n=1 Tax=Micromonospora tulbaghiae TaxID=479978 RepID=UPI0037199361
MAVDWTDFPGQAYADAQEALRLLLAAAKKLDSASSAFSDRPMFANQLSSAATVARSAAATVARVPGVVPEQPIDPDQP